MARLRITKVNADGSEEIYEEEVGEGYFDVPPSPPSAEELLKIILGVDENE